jgi:molecular chaperone HtpG
MKSEQEVIYYVTGESRAVLEGSPHMEALRARGLEVLLMTDPVDTWAAEGIAEWSGKKLVNVMRADVTLPEPEKKAEDAKAEEEVAPLLAVAKEVLGDRVRDVRVSSRLVDSLACLVLAPGAMPAHLEGLLRRSGKEVLRGKRDLELNPAHPAVKRLAAMAAEGKKEELRDVVLLVHEQALLAEGSSLEDPSGFARRLTSLMSRAFA